MSKNMEKSSKYEYLLQTWGGFYNQEHQKKHGKTEGYYFFNSKEEREKYIEELQEIEKNLNAHMLVIRRGEGEVRHQTIAKMNLEYKGKLYPIKYNFGYMYEEDSARYMFEDGNYSCDCNLSSFISSMYNIDLELDCGDLIKVKDFEVTKILGNKNLSYDNPLIGIIEL